MKALVTGASSGIGKDITLELVKRGYEIIAVAREQDKLDKLKEEVPQVIKYIAMDLSIRENCFKLYEMIKEEDIEILVNNAGFGTVGNFAETDLDTELAMIDTNCIALHILFKLFLKDMVKKNNGRILNVASIASFSPGPNMATYFSTKSYVYRLTQSVYQELKWKKSKVTVTALCPSPTRTSFDKTANVKFKMNYLTSEYVAKCGVKAMLRGKWCVTPGFTGKIDKFFAKLLPDKIMAKVVGRVPSKRNK